MLKLRLPVKSCKGTATVIFALALSVIAAMSALVIDVGCVASEKHSFQNALDAAALAAAQELPDTSGAEATAVHYIELNGYKASDITVSFPGAGDTVKVEGNLKIDYKFARLIGFDTAVLRPAASARSIGPGEAFGYTVFSGSPDNPLYINGSGFFIEGSTHTNSRFIMNGSNETITGSCEAVSTITTNGSSISIGRIVPNAGTVEMPDFSELLKAKAEEAGQVYTGDKSFNSSNLRIEEPIYVDGNVTINGSNFTGVGCIIATGNITFNGSNLNNTPDDAVCFYSTGGDIIVNGSDAELQGIVYAPAGRIIMNGSNQTINGRVIGNEIVFNGSGIRIAGSAGDLRSLPAGGVKLVRTSP